MLPTKSLLVAAVCVLCLSPTRGVHGASVAVVPVVLFQTFENDVCAGAPATTSPVGSTSCLFKEPASSYKVQCDTAEFFVYATPDCTGSHTVNPLPMCNNPVSGLSTSYRCGEADPNRLIGVVVSPVRCTSGGTINTTVTPTHSLVAIEGICTRSEGNTLQADYYRVVLQFNNVTTMTVWDNAQCVGPPKSDFTAALDGGCATNVGGSGVSFTTDTQGASIPRPLPPATSTPTASPTRSSDAMAERMTFLAAAVLVLGGLVGF